MPRVLITPEAQRDLIEIGLYIEADNPTAADRYIDRLAQAMNMLSEFRGMGQIRAELAANLRSFPVGSHPIFYLATDDGIEVIRILHGARDIRKIFRRQ